jgi:hypothetical protein
MEISFSLVSESRILFFPKRIVLQTKPFCGDPQHTEKFETAEEDDAQNVSSLSSL